MPITLKHINTADSDNIKLDKVNYNFDQLVDNGGGPIGPQGLIGQSGSQGITGQQGNKGQTGDEGYQGPMGPVSENYWKLISPAAIDADTLIPIHITGIFAPVVNIGYIETDPQYGTKPALVGGKTPYQWLLHRKQYSGSNLTFLNSDIPDNGFNFKFEKLNGKDQLTLGFIKLQNSISIYKAARVYFRGSSTLNSSLVIDDYTAYFTTNTKFDHSVAITEQLFIENAGAGVDKIAVSKDNTGWVEFKGVQELQGTVPFGTIVSIAPFIFLDNNNFINTETIYANNAVINITTGRGVGDYEGWYLCHGKEWTDGTTSGTYLVPMLGKFNYSIDDDTFTSIPTSQGVVPLTSNSETHITGGSNIGMIATSVSGQMYNITSTVDTSMVVSTDPATGTIFKIKQLPQIIYLGRNDLYWFDAGSGQAPSILLTWELDDTSEPPIAPWRLNPDPYLLGNVSDQPVGASYSRTYTVTTPYGYHWSATPTSGDIAGIPGWATITGITVGPGVFPTTISITIDVSSHPDVDTTATLSIDTTLFISATSANITLERGDPAHITCSTPTSMSISYSFLTGYTFQLVYQSNTGYAFQNPALPTSNSVLYGSPASPIPPSGGGIITILNSTLSNNNTTLTMNVSLTSMPNTGYLTSILYSISILPLSRTAPNLDVAEHGRDYIGPNDGTGGIRYTVDIANATGNTVYVWVGINHYSGTGTSANVLAYLDTGQPTTPTVSSNAGAVNMVYTTNSYPIAPGSNLAADWCRYPTADTMHDIKLYWSFNSAGTTKTPITF